MKNKERLQKILGILDRTYPDATTALDYSNPLELLVATILSAQCTDKRVNLVTPALFKKYRTARDFAQAPQEEMESYIRSTGFYRNKAKNIRGCCAMLVEKFGGRIPDTMEELTQLPGVGRKTANVLLSNAFDKNVGICVDTHVTRLSNLLGFTKTRDAVKIEQDLLKIAEPKSRKKVSDLLIHHGRAICIARRPRCEVCPIAGLCPSAKT